jgi:hypothetical protein
MRKELMLIVINTVLTGISILVSAVQIVLALMQ